MEKETESCQTTLHKKNRGAQIKRKPFGIKRRAKQRPEAEQQFGRHKLETVIGGPRNLLFL